MATLIRRKVSASSLFYAGMSAAVLTAIAGWVLLYLSPPLERALEWFVERFGLNTREYAVQSLILFTLTCALAGFIVGGAVQYYVLVRVRHNKSSGYGEHNA